MTGPELFEQFKAFVRIGAKSPEHMLATLDLVEAFKQATPELRDEPVELNEEDVEDDTA